MILYMLTDDSEVALDQRVRKHTRLLRRGPAGPFSYLFERGHPISKMKLELGEERLLAARGLASRYYSQPVTEP